MQLDSKDGIHDEHIRRKEQGMTLQSVERKLALITGANKGIGLEIARQLGWQGVTVLVGARDAGRGREAVERLRSVGMPNLRRWAGIGLAVMLAFLVMANINVALQGSRVQGLEFGNWYYYLRPFIQPIFMLWALFVSGVIWKGVSR
jgi:short chain dehydrogenase